MSAPVDPYESPLVAIERAVQERAKDISLEMSDPGGEAKLRALIEAEVERWDDDFRHGRRAYELADPEVVVERALRNMARYGPLTDLLSDGDVWEVQVNSPASVIVRRHHGLSGYHDEVFHDDEHVLRTLTKLLDDASSSHRKLDPGMPVAYPRSPLTANVNVRGSVRPRNTPRTSRSHSRQQAGLGQCLAALARSPSPAPAGVRAAR